MTKSIHFSLFYSYSKLFVILILSFTVFFYFFFSDTIKENASNALIAECDNVSTQVDAHLTSMNNLSKHLVLSKQVKELFHGDLYSLNVESAGKRLLFTDIIFSSMDYTADHITLNFFDGQGRHINIGTSSSFRKALPSPSENISWAPAVLEARGAKIFLPPHCDDWNIKSEPVVSLCRSFAQTNSSPYSSVLEIQLDFEVLQNIIDRTLSAQPEPHNLYILDSDGMLIYPFAGDGLSGMDSTAQHYYEAIHLQNAQQGILHAKNSHNGPTVFAYKTSPLTQWTVLTEVPQNILLKPVNQFRNIILVSLGLILLITLYLSYQIATNLVVPIRNLQELTASLDLKTLSKEIPFHYESKYSELNSLYSSYESMYQKLNLSLDEVVSLRSYEIQAKMLALQSQMNPHFLYNTLSTISILAEDGCCDEIVTVCDDLSTMLRYLSSSKMSKVRMQQEIEQTLAYIHLIQIKFEERILMDIDIEESIHGIYVPKLIIQPLLENCVKYALDVPPPWMIHVTGGMLDKRWYIRVTDNGTGFDPVKLRLLQNDLSSITTRSALPELQIHGMGLKNLYIRLKLTYEDNMIFQIRNPDEGGCEITIGGTVTAEERSK